MKWILIIIATTGPNAPATITTVDFGNEPACVAARNSISTNYNNLILRGGVPPPPPGFVVVDPSADKGAIKGGTVIPFVMLDCVRRD